MRTGIEGTTRLSSASSGGRGHFLHPGKEHALRTQVLGDPQSKHRVGTADGGTRDLAFGIHLF